MRLEGCLIFLGSDFVRRFVRTERFLRPRRNGVSFGPGDTLFATLFRVAGLLGFATEGGDGGKAEHEDAETKSDPIGGDGADAADFGLVGEVGDVDFFGRGALVVDGAGDAFFGGDALAGFGLKIDGQVIFPAAAAAAMFFGIGHVRGNGFALRTQRFDLEVLLHAENQQDDADDCAPND
jgi:hypothetical protein